MRLTTFRFALKGLDSSVMANPPPPIAPFPLQARQAGQIGGERHFSDISSDSESSVNGEYIVPLPELPIECKLPGAASVELNPSDLIIEPPPCVEPVRFGPTLPGTAAHEAQPLVTVSPDAASPVPASPGASASQAAPPGLAVPGAVPPGPVAPEATPPGASASEAAPPGSGLPGPAPPEVPTPGPAAQETAPPGLSPPGPAPPAELGPEPETALSALEKEASEPDDSLGSSESDDSDETAESDDSDETAEPEDEVEEILSVRASGGGNMYLVRWKGYDKSNDTWEPEINVQNCPKLLKVFWAKRKLANIANKQYPPPKIQIPPKINPPKIKTVKIHKSNQQVRRSRGQVKRKRLVAVSLHGIRKIEGKYQYFVRLEGSNNLVWRSQNPKDEYSRLLGEYNSSSGDGRKWKPCRHGNWCPDPTRKFNKKDMSLGISCPRSCRGLNIHNNVKGSPPPVPALTSVSRKPNSSDEIETVDLGSPPPPKKRGKNFPPPPILKRRPQPYETANASPPPTPAQPVNNDVKKKGQGPLKCRICGFGFHNTGNRKRHFRTVHRAAD